MSEDCACSSCEAEYFDYLEPEWEEPTGIQNLSDLDDEYYDDPRDAEMLKEHLSDLFEASSTAMMW